MPSRAMSLLKVLLVTSAVVSATVVPAGPAPSLVALAPPVFTVMNTSESPPDGVWFRNSPKTADTSRTTGLGVYVNERVEIQCFAWGDAVGPYGTTLWYLVRNLTRPTNAGASNAGYLNDHYINDGMRSNQVLPGVAECGKAAPTPTPTPTPAPTQKFNRTAARDWAYAHWQDKEKYKDADCTWYTSQALWAGGLAKSGAWTNRGRYLVLGKRPTLAAINSNEFVNYLVNAGLATKTKITWSDNTAGGAQLGDIIGYDWDNGADGTIDHVSIVTSFSGTYPNVSQHTPARKDRGWSWNPGSNNWIEFSSPGAIAYLIHIIY